MAKLRIVVFTDNSISRIVRKYKDRVEFIERKIDRNTPWADYKDKWRLPTREWVDRRTAEVKEEFGYDVDGVMFVLSRWQNGKRKLFGMHPSFLSNTYDVLFVKNRRGEEDTAFHEIKHMLDNLVRVHVGVKLESVIDVEDWDDDVVHHPRHWYDFEYRLPDVWNYVNEAIRKRRQFRKLNLIRKALEAIVIILNTMRLEKRVDRPTSEPTEAPEPPAEKTNSQKLYEVAVASLGKDASPDDLAPDELGCAETVSELIDKVVQFPIITGTWTLWDKLRRDSRFLQIGEPEVGAIIISPTGTGNGSIAGHTGICAPNGRIMSNDSFKEGKFLDNFSEESWKQRYMNRGGFPVYYYRLK